MTCPTQRHEANEDDGSVDGDPIGAELVHAVIDSAGERVTADVMDESRQFDVATRPQPHGGALAAGGSPKGRAWSKTREVRDAIRALTPAFVAYIERLHDPSLPPPKRTKAQQDHLQFYADWFFRSMLADRTEVARARAAARATPAPAGGPNVNVGVHTVTVDVGN